jgi:hypothetical protein
MGWELVAAVVVIFVLVAAGLLLILARRESKPRELVRHGSGRRGMAAGLMTLDEFMLNRTPPPIVQVQPGSEGERERRVGTDRDIPESIEPPPT